MSLARKAYADVGLPVLKTRRGHALYHAAKLTHVCRLAHATSPSPPDSWRNGISDFCLGAGGGIRTHEPLRDRVLSPAPLTRLGNSRGVPAPAPDLSVARGRP